MKIPSTVTRSSGRVQGAVVVATLLLALSLCLVSSALAVVPQFAQTAKYATGSGPRDIAIADFNLDGIDDIAVPNARGTTVSVLRGTAVGGYAAPVNVTVGSRPTAVVSADFNLDGKPDLAVANRDSDSVSILLNNGTGGFTASPALTVGDAPMDVAVGDFDRNGRPDLIVAVTGGDRLAKLTNGPGTVFAVTPVALPADQLHFWDAPRQVAVADLDDDGDDDVAVGSRYGIMFSAAPNFTGVAILTGDGAGNLSSGGAVVVPPGVVDLEACDFDRDGIVEIVGASWEGRSVWFFKASDREVKTMFETGTSSFEEFYPVDVAFGELNNPGLIDAVVSLPRQGVIELEVDAPDMMAQFRTNRTSPSDPRIYPESVTAGVQPGAVALTDVDRDGKLDLVALDFDAGRVQVMRRTLPVRAGFGYEPVATWSDAYAAEPVMSPMVAGDLNNDSVADLVTRQTVLLNAGRAAFSATPFAFVGVPVVSGDLNRDGDADVVTVDQAGDSVHVYPGNGSGGFGAPVAAATGDQPVHAAVADLDNDGDLDIVTANAGAGTVSVLLNDGSGAFAAAVNSAAAAQTRAVACGDLDNDGDLDVIAANNGAASVSVLRNNGNGSLAAKSDVAVGSAPQSLALGDFDRNGRLDAAVGRAPGSVDVLLGNGSAGFAAPVSYAAAAGTLQLQTADLSTDGSLDLVCAGGGAGPAEVTVLAGDGAGAFAAGSSHNLFTAAAGGVVVADFDADGVDDLAVGGPDEDPADLGSGTVKVVLSDTAPPATSPTPAWGDPLDTPASETAPNLGWPEWLRAPQPLQFGGSDTGAGYDKTMYRSGTASTYTPTATTTLPAPADHRMDGAPGAAGHTHYYYSLDKVRNAEDRLVRPLGIDTIDPIAGDTAPPGWTRAERVEFAYTINQSDLSGPWQPLPGGPLLFVFLTEIHGFSVVQDSGQLIIAGLPNNDDDGIHWAKGYVRDDAGNDSASHTANVRVDTRGPDTFATQKVTVNRYDTAKLPFRVSDANPNGGWAKVTLQVKNSAGSVKLTHAMSTKTTLSGSGDMASGSGSYSFWCKLAKGTYTYSVFAEDAAGNRQVELGTNKLIVR